LALPGESVLISDGGPATELEARGHDLSDPLWSARLLADAPQEIVAAHAAFFRAGATIATTTIDGTRTRAGQPLDDAFAVAAGVPQIVAVGVNCCAPDDVLTAIAVSSRSAKPQAFCAESFRYSRTVSMIP
jgi:S-methylmethionine-dependent homocysteine/selenocysteine methylase